jgi:hypothetical protein
MPLRTFVTFILVWMHVAPAGDVIPDFVQSITTSEDPQLVAFQSNETGRFEIYVVPFPNPNSKLAVSTEGGYAPRW